jgi:tetratricopeptide (TPR) repeat protein
MNLENIFNNSDTNIFKLIDDSNDNGLLWKIESTDLKLIPGEDDETYIVKAYQVLPDSLKECFLSIVTPEMVPEMVVLKNEETGEINLEDFNEINYEVIPAVASDCYGNYELYYSKINPQIGINVLKDGLKISDEKTSIAEDLGYILRDENRDEEAIEAFLISEETEPSSNYTFHELIELYKKIGNSEKELEYTKKLEDNGGL